MREIGDAENEDRAQNAAERGGQQVHRGPKPQAGFGREATFAVDQREGQCRAEAGNQRNQKDDAIRLIGGGEPVSRDAGDERGTDERPSDGSERITSAVKAKCLAVVLWFDRIGEDGIP